MAEKNALISLQNKTDVIQNNNTISKLKDLLKVNNYNVRYNNYR